MLEIGRRIREKSTRLMNARLREGSTIRREAGNRRFQGRGVAGQPLIDPRIPGEGHHGDPRRRRGEQRIDESARRLLGLHHPLIVPHRPRSVDDENDVRSLRRVLAFDAQRNVPGVHHSLNRRRLLEEHDLSRFRRMIDADPRDRANCGSTRDHPLRPHRSAKGRLRPHVGPDRAIGDLGGREAQVVRITRHRQVHALRLGGHRTLRSGVLGRDERFRR